MAEERGRGFRDACAGWGRGGREMIEEGGQGKGRHTKVVPGQRPELGGCVDLVRSGSGEHGRKVAEAAKIGLARLVGAQEPPSPLLKELSARPPHHDAVAHLASMPGQLAAPAYDRIGCAVAPGVE